MEKGRRVVVVVVVTYDLEFQFSSEAVPSA